MLVNLSYLSLEVTRATLAGNGLTLSMGFGMRLELAFLPRLLLKGSVASKAPRLSIISFCLNLPEKRKSDDYLVPRVDPAT